MSDARAARPVRGFLVDVALLVLVMVGLGLLGGIALGMSGAGIEDPTALLVMVMGVTGGAALALYLWRGRATPAERRASLAAARRPATWAWVLATAAVTFVGVTAMQWAMHAAEVQVVPTNMPIIEEGLARHPWLVLLFAAVAAPFYEEVLFRRVLFGRFLAAGKPWLGMLLSSVVFALMHEVPGTTDNAPGATMLLLAVYAAMGAAFAWVYWRTGTLWAPIAAHGLHNLASVLLLLG